MAKVIKVNCVKCGAILTAYGSHDTTVPNCDHHTPYNPNKGK